MGCTGSKAGALQVCTCLLQMLLFLQEKEEENHPAPQVICPGRHRSVRAASPPAPAMDGSGFGSALQTAFSHLDADRRGGRAVMTSPPGATHGSGEGAVPKLLFFSSLAAVSARGRRLEPSRTLPKPPRLSGAQPTESMKQSE